MIYTKIIILTPGLIKAFNAKYWPKSDPISCWDWLGSFNGEGRAKVSYLGEWFIASRVSYMLFHSLNILESHILHTCDNLKCVNPHHLFEGTQQDNMADMVSKGRQSKGIDRPKAKLTLLQVAQIRIDRKSGRTYQDIANTFAVSESTVKTICQNKSWKD